MFQLSRDRIEQLVSVDATTVAAVRDAYVAISDGRANVPPVGHIAFPDANGDCHIKYGHIAGDDVFAVKIAAGFYDNPSRGLPSSNGVVLAFSAKTGRLEALLDDEGYLTDLRTGLGGAVATFALCRSDARRFVIVGCGTQAYWVARALHHMAPHGIEVVIWGRNPDRASALAAKLAALGLAAEAQPDLEAACRSADVIVTVTPTAAPLVRTEWIQPGCHITAIGADSPGKQELDTALVAKADRRACDMLSQSLDHGEFAVARSLNLIAAPDCIELGAVLDGSAEGRRNRDEVTIADLTGVATQDIAMARTVLVRAKTGRE